jgi:hypothetical protein
MAHPGTFFYSGEKATWSAFAASVLIHGGEHFLEAIIKTFDCIGWPLLHFFEIQFHLNQFVAAHTPVIGSSEYFYLYNFHIDSVVVLLVGKKGN